MEPLEQWIIFTESENEDMLFHSLEFLIFFPVVVVVYLILPRKLKAVWLLAASYYFYMCWNIKHTILIVFSTVMTWAADRKMHGDKRQGAAWEMDCRHWGFDESKPSYIF